MKHTHTNTHTHTQIKVQAHMSSSSVRGPARDMSACVSSSCCENERCRNDGVWGVGGAVGTRLRIPPPPLPLLLPLLLMRCLALCGAAAEDEDEDEVERGVWGVGSDRTEVVVAARPRTRPGDRVEGRDESGKKTSDTAVLWLAPEPRLAPRPRRPPLAPPPSP